MGDRVGGEFRRDGAGVRDDGCRVRDAPVDELAHGKAAGQAGAAPGGAEEHGERAGRSGGFCIHRVTIPPL
ncbi:hypothetical protein TPA0905_38030 [Streptomyces olivaceus]|nr:hypothetical protein TPA0905_38030 [Streptomyces olivaceus]